MSNGKEFFPANSQEALAILYMQNQDLSGKEPEDLVEMYRDAYDRICKKYKEAKEEKAAEKRKSRDFGIF